MPTQIFGQNLERRLAADGQDQNDSDAVFGLGGDMEISTLANDKIVHAPSTASIRDAAVIMDTEGIGLVVLKDDDGVIGVVSERDILKAVATGVDLAGPASAAVEGNHIQLAAPTSTVRDVAQEMMESYIRHVLISGPDGEPVGIVSIRDLLAVIVS